MKHLIQAVFFYVITASAAHCQTSQDWTPRTPHEMSDGWESAEYNAAITFYRQLAESDAKVTMTEMGATDSGFPLHLVLVADPPIQKVESVSNDRRAVLLINNAIHPGESDGVDASLAFARDLSRDSMRYASLLEDVVVAIIPVYNIGGALNRNSGTRANQNGPREYGFRGNARNYDLNRDFIKCDSQNARSFARIFQMLDPDLLIDTHVSNGADYQHVMTTSQSQKDKLGHRLGEYLENTFQPKLFAAMSGDGYPTVPYVNSGGGPPDRGFSQFLETPRYSTGYAALFQTIGFMTETHMLKDYPVRVAATRAFLDSALTLLADESTSIQQHKEADRRNYVTQKEVAVAWEVDRNNPSRLEFHGYESSLIDSKVTTGKRLFYDRSKPFVRDVPYFDTYQAATTVRLPAGYLIPRGWHDVIQLMKQNHVEMQRVSRKTELQVEAYTIERETSRATPYEGHFFHDDVEVKLLKQRYLARPGDFVLPINQPRARYLVETLEPQAMDSLFRWNFFDTVLQRKEYFSPYVFEETAEEMLRNDSKLKAEFDRRRAEDSEFGSSRYAQLEFLYRRSPNYEAAHRFYPVLRLRQLPVMQKSE